MSALGQKRTWDCRSIDVRFTPESGHVRCNSGVRFGAIADTVPSKSCLKSEGSHYYAVR